METPPEEDHATAGGKHAQKLVKIEHVILDIYSQTGIIICRQADRQTDKQTDKLITTLCFPIGKPFRPH